MGGARDGRVVRGRMVGGSFAHRISCVKGRGG